MGPPTWPGEEVAPFKEQPLLAAARLRRYGVNYLQDAVCPGLGLLAHLDGTTVRFLPFPPHRRDESSRGACDGVVAEIDLGVGRRNLELIPRGGKGGDHEAGEIARQVSAVPFWGLARGLSWANCGHSAVATTAAAAKANGVCPTDGGSMAAEGLARVACSRSDGGGQQEREKPAVAFGVVGAGNAMGGESGGGGEDGEKVCHIAVACGPEVLLWRVSRVSWCEQESSAAGASEDRGTKHRRYYRYSVAQVLTDWHAPEKRGDGDCGERGGHNSTTASVNQGLDGDGMRSKGRTAAPAKASENGGGQDLSSFARNVRCLFFRPCAGGSVGVPAAMRSGDGAIPLAAWYDTGAAVLGPGGNRMVLPAPVRRKRACGAWSGCGRRLALSSGGEIRVYSDPCGQGTPSAAAVAGDDGEANVALDSCPAKKRNAWVGSNTPAALGQNGTDVPPVAAGEPERTLLDGARTAPTGRLGAGSAGSTFHTVLCVEATVYEGGVLSSPGSSPGGSPCPSPPARKIAASRRLGVDGAKNGIEDKGLPLPLPLPRAVAVPSGVPEKRSEGELGGGRNDSPFVRAASSSRASAMGASLSQLVLGDMRAMCPAGPLAFFGATDGGLGLDPAFAPSGPAEANGAFVAGSDHGDSERDGDGLLGAIVDDSNLMRADDPNAVGGGSAYAPSRRRGFRHVLPGENWLAGSLRPSSRAPRPDSSLRQQVSHSREPLSRPSTPSESRPVVSSAESNLTEGGTSDRRVSPGAPRLASVSPPPVSAAAPEVLDLRGKLGGRTLGASGLVEGAATHISAVSTHPLFHLSLSSGGGGGGGIGPVESPAVRSSVSSRSEGSHTCSTSIRASHTAGAGATTGRGPWLVRASCRSSGVGVKALAPLPPGLASPDLLASSEDGNFVAVGSHACDLVACYRLERQPSSGAEESVLDSLERDPARNGGQASPADKSGARRQGRRRRRAVPLCTLRLPVGYRAKGVTFVADGQPAGTIDAMRISGSANVAGGSVADSGGAMAREVVVLVLAGCIVPDTNSNPCDSRHPSKHGVSFPADFHRGGARRSSAEGSYRTMLLKFSLPSGCSTRGGKGVTMSVLAPTPSAQTGRGVGFGGSTMPGRSCARDEIEATRQDRIASTNKNDPLSAWLSAGAIGSGRATPDGQVIGEPDGVDGGGGASDERMARLETAVLRAVAGVERRVDERFNQMERILGGVCDRLEALEGAVNRRRSAAIDTAVLPSES